jgi:type III secretory pathway lipoprotein EscJ
MQTKFEYSAEETNNAAKIPHQMSLFIKQRENINTSKEMPQK